MDKKNQRKLEWIVKPEKIESMIQKHLLNKYLFLKSLEDPPKIRIIEINPNQTFKIASDVVLDLDKEYIIYRVLGRYLEVHFKTLTKGEIQGIYNIQIKAIGISLIEREHLRIPIKNNEVYITNFLTSKHLIDSHSKMIPTTIKIGFTEFEKKIKNLYDFVRINTFEEQDPLIELIKKTQKFILVKDSFDLEQFGIEHPEVLNLKKIFNNNLDKIIHRYRKLNIKSELIAPLFYLTHDYNYILIGYIQLQNKNKTMDIEELEKVKQWNQELITRLLEINTIQIQEKEEVLNISKNGFRAKIRNLNLINYLLKQSGFSCDIVFKGQPPISIFVEIRSSARDTSGILYIGTKIINFKKEEQKNLYLNLMDLYEKKFNISQIQSKRISK
jgi:hypothetical protein